MDKKEKDEKGEKSRPRVTADKEIASECNDPEAPRVTRSGRNFQQAAKSTKSVHYTPDLPLNQALNKAEKYLAGISPGDSGSQLSSSISLVNDSMDESSVPLDYSTPNQSLEVEGLAAGLINDLVSDITSGEFTGELMERAPLHDSETSESTDKVSGNSNSFPHPIEVICVPTTVKSENETESIEGIASSTDTTTRFEGTPEWDNDIPGWPTRRRANHQGTVDNNQHREIMSPEQLLRLSERLSDEMIPSSTELLRVSEQLTDYMSKQLQLMQKATEDRT